MNHPSAPTNPQPLTRRDFMAKSALSAFAIALPTVAVSGSPRNSVIDELMKERKMGIVVHSYATRWNSKIESSRYPGFLDALSLIRHCHAIGAGGVQVGISNWTPDFARQVRSEKEKLGMYVEGSVAMPFEASDVATFDKNIAAARAAGVDIVRTVCTSGRRYEIYHSAADFETARSKAITCMQLGEPVLKKHKMKLGVENHKDWRATELAELIKKMNSEWIGVTLDFGNSIALMEDPMEVVTTLAPLAVSTHVKDMGVQEYDGGLLLSEVPLGTGILDLNAIVSICRKHNPGITFNLEMITRDPLVVPCLTDDYWSTFSAVHGLDLARTLRMVRAHKPKDGLPHVSGLSNEQRLGKEEQNILESLAYSAIKMEFK